MSFQLHVLGGLSLTRDGQRLGGAANQRKPLVLLAIIERAGARGISRDKLRGLLAPESNEERARGVLNQLLHAVRKETGETLAAGVSTLSLDPAVVDCDLRQFQQFCAAGAWREAVALYRGPYLEGVRLADAPELDEWIEEQRGAVDFLYRKALLELAKADDAASPGGGRRWWNILCVLDPMDAGLTVGWMRSLAEGGERSAAINVALDHQRRVREATGLEVEESIQRALGDLQGQAPPQARPVHRKRRIVVSAAMLLVITAFLGAGPLHTLHSRESEPPVAEVVRLKNDTGVDSLGYLGAALAERLSTALDDRRIAHLRHFTDSAPEFPDLAVSGSYRLRDDSLVIDAEARETGIQFPVFTRRLALQMPATSETIDSFATAFALGLRDRMAVFREEWGIDATHNARAVVRFMGVYHAVMDDMMNCRKGLDHLDSAYAADPTLMQPLILQIQISVMCTSPYGELPDTLRYERIRQTLLAAQPTQDPFVSAFVDFVLHPDSSIRLHAGRIMVADAPRSEMVRGLLIRSLADHNQFPEAIRVYEAYPGARRLAAVFDGDGFSFVSGQSAYMDGLHLAGRYRDELRLAEAQLALIDTASLWKNVTPTEWRARALAALHRPLDIAEVRNALCCSLGPRGSSLLVYLDELAVHGDSALVHSFVAGRSCLNLERQLSEEQYRQVLKGLHQPTDTASIWLLVAAQKLIHSAERSVHFDCVDDATHGLVDVTRPIADSLYYMAVMGELAARQGRVASADTALSYLRRIGPAMREAPGRPVPRWSFWVPGYRMARILARLGRRQEAFAKLAEVVKDGFPLAMQLHTDPLWHSYRDDPIFRAAIGQ